jgi:hypothetical protein
MNTRILLLAVGVAALSSCSSVYKSGQTPDDVYFSPARPQAEYVEVQKDEDKYQSYEQYQDNYRNDRFLRMSVGNPYYLNAYNSYDGFDWRYNSFIYDSYGYGFNSPWSSYWAWNNYYNPYCSTPFIYYGGAGSKFTYSTPVSRPIAFNPSSYINNPANRSGRTYSNGNYYNNTNQRYNNNNGSSGLRFSNPNHSTNNNNYSPSNNTSTPSRSYSPSSSGSSSSPSSGGGGGGVSRPGRGGR